MQGFKTVVGSTVFTPANPVAAGYMRNMRGSATNLPTRIAAGTYRTEVPEFIPLQQMSITARGYNAAGALRHIAVVPSETAQGELQLDIFIRDAADALTDDCVNVEVSVERLPVA